MDPAPRHCSKFFLPRPVDIPQSAARYCERCETNHPARNGTGWLETTGGLFGTRKFFIAQYGGVWDATDYAECGCFLWNPDIPVNAHTAPFTFVRGRPKP